MYTVEPAVVQNKMRLLFGEERYRKFVAEMNGRCRSKHRLFYWQEVMWEKVQEELGIYVTDFSAIASLFRVCHVHGEELERGVAPVLYGTRQLTGKYIEAQEALFPNANDVVFGPCWEEATKQREVLFCSACRGAKSEWSQGRGT